MKKIISVILILLIMLFISIQAHAMEAGNMKIVSNGNTTFLIESDGTVKGWGLNTKGEVGNGSTVDQLSPIAIPELTNIKAIIANEYGYGFFFAIDNDGNVYSWGYNGYRQLGLGNVNQQTTPTLIPDLPEISQIVLNKYTVYAITADGDVYAWGKNNYGQVGNDSKTTQRTPVKITQLSNIVSITCKEDVAYAINENGNVYSWGRGNRGQIGNNTYIITQKTPVEVIGLSGVERIITNGNTTFALCQDGHDVYGWGDNNFGEIGCRGISRKLKPVLLSDISGVKELVIAANTTYAILDDGTLYGWGRNGYAQLANGGSFDKHYPLLISGIPHVKQIISNGYSTCVLGVDNSVYTWRYNQAGEVGNGTSSPQRTAYKISSLDNIVKIDGSEHTLFAIDADGCVYSWGQNNHGQLGIGTSAIQRSPAVISRLSDIVDIQKNKYTVLAIDSRGNYYGWGNNGYGQLGDGTIEIALSSMVILQNDLTTTTGTGDVTSVVPIVGSINVLTISVTHPANIAYTIDPNSENGFYALDIDICNNSKVPVRITIESFNSNSEGDLQFIDVLPDSKDWDNLNL